MRGTLLGIAALAAVLSALALVAPRPAGACSIVCVNQRWGLTLAEVEIVDDGGDTDATLPEWADVAVLENGSVILRYEDGTEVQLDYAEEGP